MHAGKIKYGAWRLLFAFFIWILGCTCVRGQEYSYAQYSVKDGLAGSVVYCGAEDKDGFLWFGTETGLSRFDGTHFKNFTTSDGLPDNEILRLFVDSKNRVWIIPFRHTICYYYKGKIHNQQNDTLLAKISISGELRDICEDEKGNVIVVSAYNVFLISGNELREIILPFKMPYGFIRAGINHEGKFLILCNNVPGKLTSITLGKDFAYNFSYEPIPIWGSTKDVGVFPHVLVHVAGDSLCFSWAGRSRLSKHIIPPGFITFSYLNDSLCSINTGSGAIIFNYRTRQEVRQCLQDKSINNVFIDSEGNYWFMTYGSGIARISSFEFRSFSAANKPIENEIPVFCIRQVGDKIYAGASGSIFWTINPVSLKKTEHQIPIKSKSTRVICMESLPDSSLLLGTDDGVIEISHGKFRQSVLKPAVKAISLYKDSILLATNVSTFIVSQALIIDRFVFLKRATASLVHNDMIYLGTLDGLYSLDSNHHAIYLGQYFPELKSRISAISKQADGTLWIATNGHGVVCYKDGRIIRVITEKEGLSSNICRSIFASDAGVWVGTDKGLNRLRKTNKDYAITVFTRVDGLIADIINAIYVDGSRVYVGTSSGLTLFDADKVANNSYCKLRITGFFTNDSNRVYDPGDLKIPHDRNNIRIEYSGISYRSAGNISYRYRLAGLNDTWQTTHDSYLSFPSLASGKYELQIIATNKFGVRSEMLHIPFIIEALLWERTWFRALVIILIGLILWIFVNLRITRVKKQNDEKISISNRLAELEQMALKAQMNPHFIFNSLNSLQHYVIEKDVAGANKFITEFSRLIRLTLDMSTKTSITIYEEISYITTYLELEKTKFEDKFSYEVKVEPGLNAADWDIPPMILQPYVENSIRHGVRNRRDKLGHIVVSFSRDEAYLICVVEDSGVGRETAAQFKSQMPIEYQSKGMTLTAKRIEMLNRDRSAPVLITIEDLYYENKPAGTRVTVRFPLDQAGR